MSEINVSKHTTSHTSKQMNKTSV